VIFLKVNRPTIPEGRYQIFPTGTQWQGIPEALYMKAKPPFAIVSIHAPQEDAQSFGLRNMICSSSSPSICLSPAPRSRFFDLCFGFCKQK
jgi:hypothetical protein